MEGVALFLISFFILNQLSIIQLAALVLICFHISMILLPVFILYIGNRIYHSNLDKVSKYFVFLSFAIHFYKLFSWIKYSFTVLINLVIFLFQWKGYSV